MIVYKFSIKTVKFVYNKMNFITQDKIYKQFLEEDTLDILLRTIRFLDIEIALTHV